MTNRLRYYSCYCWVVALWAKIRHADDEPGWNLFIRRAEALYALACEAVEPTHGLAGSEWAQKYWAELKGTKIDLRPHTNRPGENGQYLMAKRGNFGQFYIASMFEVGLLGDSARIPIVADRGKALGDAFASAIGEGIARELADAIDGGKLEKDELLNIGKAVHPSRLKSNTREMALLREFLCPESSTIRGSKARRTSALLLLDLAQRGVSISDENTLRGVFYHRALPDGTPYSPGGRIIDRWRAFHANELCHIALEALLNAIASMLVRRPTGIEPSVLVRELVKRFIADNDSKAVWSEWARKACDGASDTEYVLSRDVLDGLKRYNVRAEDVNLLTSATKLIGVLWHKWGAGQDKVLDEIAQFSINSGASLAGVIATLNESGKSTVHEALEAVLRRHVIADHLVIAGRKLAVSGKYTYRFVLEDGLLSDGWIAEYGYTNPRLRNLVNFLVDAKLVDADGKVTEPGQRLVDGYQPA